LETNILSEIDALHIACAIEWKPLYFITTDHRQGKAEKKATLKIQIH
jgi:hypothetical protein